MLDAKIKVLPDNIVNKIAAGEIIERPAAVVKELVENSLDAGAKNIAVRFSKGGKFSIIVEDDGVGMSKDDALLSLERHATSKLRDISDLNALYTFGFRGEAIPSIASISKFSMLTCKNVSSRGTEILIDGGKVLEIKEHAKFVGTKISVENLFFNVPARRKFLKSDETESSHIISLIKNLAIAEPEVNFTLFQNGSQIFSSPKSGNFGDRANEIFECKEKFIDFEYSKNGLKLFGTVCDPEFGDICRKNITVFVNNRIVKSDLIALSMSQSLQGVYPNHRGIFAYIFLKIMPECVDVNVHPMKKEVRFKNELQIRDLVTSAMESLFKHDEQNLSRVAMPIIPLQISNVPHAPYYNNSSKIGGVAAVCSLPSNNFERSKIITSGQMSFNLSDCKKDIREWEFIGLGSGGLAIFESKTGIIFFNTKLAVRRITFDRITSNIYNASTQSLLFPIEISLTKEQEERLKEMLPIIEKHGFSIYQSGERDYKIDGVPEWLPCDTAEIALRSAIFDECSFEVKSDSEDIGKMFAKNIAKFSKTENYRSQTDIEKLCDQLFMCKNHLICPEGNVIFFEITNFDIERRFSTTAKLH